MPRTKKLRSTSFKPNIDYEEYLNRDREQHLQELRALRAVYLEEFNVMCDEQELYYKMKMNKTIGEYLNNGSCSSVISLSESKIKRIKRSLSAGDDEGYRTNDSSSGSGVRRTTRRSRSVQRSTAHQTRVSRSLSRLNVPKKTVGSRNIKTPLNKQPPNSDGTITPKVNLNTPQAILRRPNFGEMAVSLQGSPLLLNACMSDNRPNINIPLRNGTVISVQPHGGLRQSQIPDLDNTILEQLETLRDNLMKLVSK